MTPEEQRRIALDNAKVTKLRRAELKHALKEGRMSLGQAFQEPFLHTMTVEALLRACPGIGRVKAPAILARAQISPQRPVKLVTERQQAVILEFVA